MFYLPELYNKGYSKYNVKRSGRKIFAQAALSSRNILFKGGSMENLFSIGEVARYQKISKQTLIFYDKIGLFRPDYVDPHNGYRYYSAKQLDYLDAILIMKIIGFSLSEIKEHMQHYTIDSSLAAMKNQLSVIDSRIRELYMIRSRLMNRCQQMEETKELRGKENAVFLEDISPQYILIQPVEEPYTLREISIATKKCFAGSFQKQLPVFFQCGVIVPLERIREGRYTEASHAFLPIEKTDKAENIQSCPPGNAQESTMWEIICPSAAPMKKSWNTAAATTWRICSDSYEFCINDYITSYDENEYITKILFYVTSDD